MFVFKNLVLGWVDKKRINGFEIETRNTWHYENLSEKISHVDPKNLLHIAMPRIILLTRQNSLSAKYTCAVDYESVIVPLFSTFCTKNLLPIKKSIYDLKFSWSVIFCLLFGFSIAHLKLYEKWVELILSLFCFKIFG